MPETIHMLPHMAEQQNFESWMQQVAAYAQVDAVLRNASTYTPHSC